MKTNQGADHTVRKGNQSSGNQPEKQEIRLKFRFLFGTGNCKYVYGNMEQSNKIIHQISEQYADIKPCNGT